MGVESMTKKFVLALATAALCLGASACNTVKGAGRDIESVGQAGSDAIH
jgi:predicted small secreted protein